MQKFLRMGRTFQCSLGCVFLDYDSFCRGFSVNMIQISMRIILSLLIPCARIMLQSWWTARNWRQCYRIFSDHVEEFWDKWELRWQNSGNFDREFLRVGSDDALPDKCGEDLTHLLLFDIYIRMDLENFLEEIQNSDQMQVTNLTVCSSIGSMFCENSANHKNWMEFIFECFPKRFHAIWWWIML